MGLVGVEFVLLLRLFVSFDWVCLFLVCFAGVLLRFVVFCYVCLCFARAGTHPRRVLHQKLEPRRSKREVLRRRFTSTSVAGRTQGRLFRGVLMFWAGLRGRSPARFCQTGEPKQACDAAFCWDHLHLAEPQGPLSQSQAARTWHGDAC